MRDIVWSTRASQEYLEAIAYRAAHDPDGAERLGDRLSAAAAALGKIPTGRPGRRGMFEKSLPDVRYIIAYAVDEPPGTLTILRVIHMARHWPDDSWPD